MQTNLHPVMTEALRPFLSNNTKLFTVKDYELVHGKINVVIVQGIKTLAPVLNKPVFEKWLQRCNRTEMNIPTYWERSKNIYQDLYDFIVLCSPLNNPFA